MISDKIKELRKQKGWTLKELSNVSGIAFEQLSRYENGKHRPNSETLEKLAKALNVSISYWEGGHKDNVSADALPDKTISKEYYDLILKKAAYEVMTNQERRMITEFFELVLFKKQVKALS